MISTQPIYNKTNLHWKNCQYLLFIFRMFSINNEQFIMELQTVITYNAPAGAHNYIIILIMLFELWTFKFLYSVVGCWQQSEPLNKRIVFEKQPGSYTVPGTVYVSGVHQGRRGCRVTQAAGSIFWICIFKLKFWIFSFSGYSSFWFFSHFNNVIECSQIFI